MRWCSDTTTTTLAGAFYQLAHHPEHIEKLRAELAPYVDPNNPTGDIDGYKIAHLDHLNGILNETLRLFPVAPSTLPRKTPLEGLEIDGVYIPGEMTVTCPQWTLGRCKFFDRSMTTASQS